MAEKLHLPGNPLRAAEILGNKAKFRGLLLDLGIPAPRGAILKQENGTDTRTRIDAATYDEKADVSGREPREKLAALLFEDTVCKGDVNKDVEEFHYPLLVKPLDSSGSKGITLLRESDPQCLLLAYRNALIHSRSGKVLVEEAIPYGYPNLIGGDVMVWEGEIWFFGLMDCIREEQDGLVPCGKIWPSRAPQGIRRKITEILQQVIQKLQIWDAELNVEFIAGEDEKIYPIEIALRCGGNGIPQLLSDIVGVDWIGEEIRRTIREPLLGKSCRGVQRRDKEPTKSAVWATWNLHTNQYGWFAGYEISEPLTGFCYRTELFKRTGEEVIPFTHAGGIIGILYFCFPNEQEAEKWIRHFSSDIRVHVTPNLQKEIIRLGEYMNPSFSIRKLQGWDPEAYARKLTEKAEILTETDGNGRFIGLIVAYLNRKESGFISMLVVDPQYRRLGVAETLCRRVHQLARTRGILQMRGEIREENLACQMLARKLGYRKEKNGEWRISLAEEEHIPH